MTFPYIPEDAPFNDGQRQWLSGFFAGMKSRLLESEKANKSAGGETGSPVAILYGTQTGNAEGLAQEAAEHAVSQGMQAQVLGMDEIEADALPSYDRLLLITSTYGDGEMPDNAISLWNAVQEEGTPRLENTHFAVLALGDTSYDLFCQAGIDWERRLEELGAKKIVERVDCDLEFEEPFAQWIDDVMPALAKLGGGASTESAAIEAKPKPVKSKWTKKNPFPAKILKNETLTDPKSSKETRHYEISLEGSDITYEVGDALGVIPTNCPVLVDEIISALGVDPLANVTVSEGESKPLRDALFSDFEIKTPSKELLAAVAERSADKKLNELLDPSKKKELTDFLWGKDSIDLLLDYHTAVFTAEEFVALLKRVQPRLYSISSSIAKHLGEVHLTVASVRYESNGRDKKGVCSTFLADRVSADTDILCYPAPNKNFGVPADENAPMIMVGPGTGVAPFRAFLEERDIRKSPGKNWLFFGERNRASDFFYEDELTDLQERGVLTRLDLAFSRDQEAKIYVQDRMRENGKELYQWLEEGGYFFVCGDAYRMAKDVDKALLDIVAEHGGKSEEAAQKYVQELSKAKRYVRDVY
ncbi:MAG: sulfite reductase subunit alpha [Verrucomicrobiota bacterium]